MNEKIKFIIIGVIIGAVIMFAGTLCVGIWRTRTDSQRIGQLQSELDAATRELASANERSIELLRDIEGENARSAALVRDIGNGIGGIAASLTDGTQSLSNRIREAAKRVALLENTLDSYRGGGGNIYNGGNSNGE